MPPQRAARLRAHAAASVELLGRELTAEEQESWQASCDSLADSLGFPPDECNRLLARAFGWTTQAFWRREKIDEVPRVEQLEDVVAFLRDELGMGLEEQQKVVRSFPEVLACSPEARLAANVGVLQKQWRLQGAILAKAVLRQPAVLGYSLDCGGDCVGECNRCWARF